MTSVIGRQRDSAAAPAVETGPDTLAGTGREAGRSGTGPEAGRDSTDRPAPGLADTDRMGAVIELAGPPAVTLVPVSRHGRPVGAYVLSGGAVCYRPVVDLDRVLSTALAAVAVGALGVGAATWLRRPPAVGRVTMGPGGWISLKGLPAPALRGHDDRPWWARLLRAHRLEVRR